MHSVLPRVDSTGDTGSPRRRALSGYRRGVRLWVTAAVMALASFCPGVKAVGQLSEGEELYRSGRYLEAVIALSRVVEAEPSSALAHYYLANSLASIKQYEDAISEYEYCHHLSPHSKLGSYSLLAIERFRPLADRQSRAQRREPLVIPAIQTPPGHEELSNKRRSLLSIKRQTEWEKMRSRREGTASIDAVMNRTELSVKRIQDEAERAIAEISGPGRRRRRDDDPRVREIQRETAQAIAEARQHAQMVARRHMRDYVARAKALEECASNLETQMVNAPDEGVRLQAAGTNLYVRNYEYVQPEALVAVAKRLEPRWSARR